MPSKSLAQRRLGRVEREAYTRSTRRSGPSELRNSSQTREDGRIPLSPPDSRRQPQGSSASGLELTERPSRRRSAAQQPFDTRVLDRCVNEQQHGFETSNHGAGMMI